MRFRLFTILARTVTGRPCFVLGVGVALTIVSAIVASGLKLKASRFDLVPSWEPSVVAYQKYEREFGSLNSVFLILNGSPDRCRAFLDKIAAKLGRETDRIASLQYKVDLERFRQQALWLMEPGLRSRVEKDITDLAPLVVALSEEPSFGRFLGHVIEELSDTGPPPPIQEVCSSLEFVRDALRHAVRRLLAVAKTTEQASTRQRAFPSLALEGDSDHKVCLDARGYLCSTDGRRYLMVLNPARELDDSALTRAFLTRLNADLTETRKTIPGVTWLIGGGPIGDLEEEVTIEADLARTSVVACVLVFVLSTLALGHFVFALLANLVLGAALLFTSAVSVWLVGSLNLISSVFLAILVGLGMDFAIYLFTLYRDTLPRFRGPDASAQAFTCAILLGGPGMLTGAITTAAAFYSLLFHRFVAFQELGLVAGSGVLLAWISMITFLPAIVVLKERKFPSDLDSLRRGDDPRTSRIAALLAGLARPRRQIPTASAILVLASLACAWKVPFDYNLSHLQSKDAPNVHLEEILRDEFHLSADYCVILCTTLDAARQVTKELSGDRSIGVIDSPTDLVTQSGATRPPEIDRIARSVRRLPPLSRTAPSPDVRGVIGQLDSLPAALKGVRTLAKMEKSAELTRLIGQVEDETRQARELLTQGPVAQARLALASVGSDMVSEVGELISTLANSDGIAPFTLETLPSGVRSRYVGRSGSVAVYVSPRSELSSQEFAQAFVDRCESLAGRPGVKGVAGIPIVVFRMMELIRRGFRQAAVLAFLAVTVIVFLDFRKAWLTLLALVPMVCGSAWMAGLVAASKTPWNPLNSLAIPVILGVGIAFGINLIHRCLNEQDVAVALAGTGRAIFYSAATAMAGFGSLVLSHHRGLASFGATLGQGVFATMVAALVLTPILFQWGRPREDD